MGVHNGLAMGSIYIDGSARYSVAQHDYEYDRADLDGNETWLVFGGLGLLAAFPLAFAIIIPAVYFPILVVLLGLVFRGVAFEFRFYSQRMRCQRELFR
jgi:hypothetical protein